jgi:hypothetical protein
MTTRLAPRLLLLVACTVALAAIGTAASWAPPHWDTLLFWAVVSLAAELMWIRLPVGDATLSMASCSHFAALLMLPRGHAMAVTAVTGALAEAFVLRKPAPRVLFNAAQTAIAVGAASWLYGASGGGALLEGLTHGRLLPILAAACAYFAVNTGLVSLAVSLSERVSWVSAWLRNFGHAQELVAGAALLSLGTLLAIQYAATGVAGTVLVAFPVALAHQSYRLTTSRRDAARDDTPQSRAA